MASFGGIAIPSAKEQADLTVDRTITSRDLSILDRLFETPDLYVRDVDWKTCEAICLRMSRDSYARSSFLDHRTIADAEGDSRLPVAALMDAYGRQRPRLGPSMFIAHTALCGSTLLTRCIDLPGICMTYREPFLFHNLSGIWRLGLQEKVHARIGRREPPILDLALALCARTYDDEERSVVKLSDTCTSLLPPILARSPDSRVLLMYHELERFLLAMLRHESRRQYVRNMRIRAEVDLRAVGREDITSTEDLSDARCAALVWMGLMYPYRRLLAKAPDRVRSLNAATFFTHPADVLETLDEFFHLDIGKERLQAQIAGGAMNRDAKHTERTFDADRYKADLESAAAELRHEIDDAIAWTERVSAVEPLGSTLPNPL
ncbi:MAG: hypothetical protein PVI25_00050 [Gammaproteobacteria bacterium]|jgi:hypothetical protein